MRALVTGASGFIGFHLCEHLHHIGWDVTAVIRRASAARALEPFARKMVFADVLNAADWPAILAGQQVVFHLAGKTKGRRKKELFATNCQGVRSVLSAAVQTGGEPICVIVSSLAAVGPARHGPHQESAPAVPVSYYGQSKLAGEWAAREFSHRLAISIVRPPIVFGPGDRGTLPVFETIYRTRIHLVPGYRPKQFSLIDARDLVHLLVLVALHGERLPQGSPNDENRGTGIYFADCGFQPRYDVLGTMVGEALGYKSVFRLPLPHWGVYLVGGLCEAVYRPLGKMPIMSIDKAREATAGSWICSGEKAFQHLGFRVETSLAQRLHETAQWYRAHGWL